VAATATQLQRLLLLLHQLQVLPSHRSQLQAHQKQE
jgi:hypothetical protein